MLPAQLWLRLVTVAVLPFLLFPLSAIHIGLALQPQIHLRTAISNGLTLFTTLGCGSFERRVELRFGCTHNHLVFVYIPLLALSMVGSPLVSFDLWLRSVWCSQQNVGVTIFLFSRVWILGTVRNVGLRWQGCTVQAASMFAESWVLLWCGVSVFGLQLVFWALCCVTQRPFLLL